MFRARSFVVPIVAAVLFSGLAQAQDEAQAVPVPAGLKLNLIPIDAPVVVVFRPSTLLKMPSIKPIYDEFTRDPEVKKLADLAEPESIDEISYVLLNRDMKQARSPDEAFATNGAIIVKTNKPREWKALAAAAQMPMVKATHAGKDYFRISGDAPFVFGFYQADDKTMIAASEMNLQKMMEAIKDGSDVKSPRIAGVTPKTVAAATVDFVWIREMLTPGFKNQPGMGLSLSVVSPIWEKTTYIASHIDVDDDQKITLTVENSCTNEDGAKAVEKTVEAIMTLTRNVAPEYFKMVRVETENRPEAKELVGLAEQALKTATLTREESRVRFQVSVKADLAKLVKTLR